MKKLFVVGCFSVLLALNAFGEGNNSPKTILENKKEDLELDKELKRLQSKNPVSVSPTYSEAPVKTSAPATSAPANLNVVKELFNYVYHVNTLKCLPTEDNLKELFIEQYIIGDLVFDVNKQGKFGMLSSFTWINTLDKSEEKVSTVTFTTIASCIEFKLQIAKKMGDRL